MSAHNTSSVNGGFREEVFNVFLAILLSDRGIVSVPENIRRITPRTRRIPDITITEFWGIKIIIEGRINDSAGIENSLLNDARRRIEEGLSPICIAVLYPPDIRHVGWDLIKDTLATSDLRVKVLTDSVEEEWYETNVDGLAAVLRRAYEILVKDDVVSKTVELLKESIENATENFSGSPATPERFRSILGVFGERDADDPHEDDLRVCRIASLVIINALIFQEVLSSHEHSVNTIRRTLDDSDIISSFSYTWKYILDDINYVPIFRIAREILLELSSNPESENAIQILSDAALLITSRRAALKHDLMGRIYHRLLVDAKYFGAYYTMIPSATLLSELTFNPRYWDVNFSEQEQIRSLKIADLACGTGTLLKASLESIADDYVTRIIEEGGTPKLGGLYKSLVEETIYGYDVLPFASHLSASTLALHAPEIPFDRMNLFVLPLGGPSLRLGSLDFLSSRSILIQQDLFGALNGPSQVTGQGDISTAARIPELDLCVMNPPFTRSVGGNLLFGSYEEEERSRMQQRLQDIVRRENIQANITAGLGSVFVALADKYIKSNGHLSLVLPKSLLSGVSWKPTRDLLDEKYRVRYIIVSHEPNSWNFSENTKLSECLLVADKNGNSNLADTCYIVNLWHRPTSNTEALSLKSLIQTCEPANIDSIGITELSIDSTKYGEVIGAPSGNVMNEFCMIATSFAQTDLVRTAHYLRKGTFYLPTQGIIQDFPLVPLEDIFDLGFDQRDIHDGFNRSPSETSFPAFWGHDSNSVTTLIQNPNRYLSPLPRARLNRPLRNANLLWRSASDLLLVERLRLNTHRLTSIMCTEAVLSTWWTVKVRNDIDSNEEHIKKTTCLWLNSSLGILSLYTVRSDTEGAWIKLKKPSLKAMPILDPRMLNNDQISEFLTLYDEVSNLELLNLSQANEDVTRQLIDDSIARILNIPNFQIIRNMLSREPAITLESIN